MSDEQAKFKVGDVVKRIAHNVNTMLIGSKWVVKEVDKWDGSISVVGLENEWWSPRNFELVSCNDVAKDDQTVDKQLYSPLAVQQAGDHYKKRGIQPIEYGLANNLSFPQVNIVKYVTRHEDKNGLDDLAKSIHYHFFEALRVYGEEGSDELRKKVLSLLEFEDKESK